MGLENADAILVSPGSTAKLSATATASIRSIRNSVYVYQPMVDLIARHVAVVRVWWFRVATDAHASKASRETCVKTLISMTVASLTPRPVAPTRRFKSVYVAQTSNVVRTLRVWATKYEVGTMSVST
eukprot:GILK01002476.1.p3 GENE.GILK01002476.1~~GILK01002476.1.p3  ORF type:complete len:127 (-),score=4.18 GILK01002476.1:234-614(-)